MTASPPFATVLCRIPSCKSEPTDVVSEGSRGAQTSQGWPRSPHGTLRPLCQTAPRGLPYCRGEGARGPPEVALAVENLAEHGWRDQASGRLKRLAAPPWNNNRAFDTRQIAAAGSSLAADGSQMTSQPSRIHGGDDPGRRRFGCYAAEQKIL